MKTFGPSPFVGVRITRLIEWATKAAGADVYEDYKKYTNTPEEARKKLDKIVKYNHDLFFEILKKMYAYKSNPWWITYGSIDEMVRASKYDFPDIRDVDELEKEAMTPTQKIHFSVSNKKQSAYDKNLAFFRKKLRVWFQLDCGVDTLLIPQSRFLDDCNDILQYNGYTGRITSWMLHQYKSIFANYETILRNILEKDEELMAYVKRHKQIA